MRDLASEAVNFLATDGYLVELLDFPHFEALYGEAAPTPSDFRIASFSPDATVIILHSSGTSAFPKPIEVTHRTYLAWGTAFCGCTAILTDELRMLTFFSIAPDYGEIDVCGTRFGIHTAPVFHSLGSTMLVHAVCTGIELAVFKPMRPPIASNAATYLQGLVESKSDWVMSVPSLIEVCFRQRSLHVMN